MNNFLIFNLHNLFLNNIQNQKFINSALYAVTVLKALELRILITWSTRVGLAH